MTYVILRAPTVYGAALVQARPTPFSLLELDPFPKILSFLTLNPGAFTIDDAPPDTSEWADDEVDPRLELLINLIGDLALRHDSVRACLPIPNALDFPPTDAIHGFKLAAHTRVFNDELLPLLELAHEFKQESRFKRYVKALHSRGHRYPISNDLFLTMRRRLLRTRTRRKSRHHFNRHSHANNAVRPAPRDSLPTLHALDTAVRFAPRDL